MNDAAGKIGADAAAAGGGADPARSTTPLGAVPSPRAGSPGGPARLAAPFRPAFDERDRPEQEILDRCTHCGFCLPTCPTYILWAQEMDSPRGRIHLMRLGNEDRVEMTPAFVEHMDLCLGCMACTTACPSGVEYGTLIESARRQVDRRYARPLPDRLFRAFLFQVFPRPDRLRALARLLRLYQRTGLQKAVERTHLISRLPGRLAALNALMPHVRASAFDGPLPEHIPARGKSRARVGMLTGCVQSVFFAHVNAATARVLASEGCDVFVPRGQTCCGALGVHVGREEDAKESARRMIDLFDQEPLDYIAINAAGCGSTMKEYGHLLREDPDYAARASAFSARVRDVSELLEEIGPVARRRPLKATVAYHDACHLAHAQGIRQQPRALLRSIPGIELVAIADSDTCCGSAGIYNLVNPEPAGELGERKVRTILESGARIVASANPGCTLQIEATARRMGHRLTVLHPIEILDISLHGKPKRSGA